MSHTIIWSDEHPLEWIEPEDRLIAPDEALGILGKWVAEACEGENADPVRANELYRTYSYLYVRDLPVRATFRVTVLL